MMAYVAKTAGNRYTQAVIAAMPMVGKRIADNMLDQLAASITHEPEVIRFPETEVGGASDAVSITIATSSTLPMDVDDVEVHPTHSDDGPSHPGEYIAWEPSARQVRAGHPLMIDVQFHPSRVATTVSLLRLRGRIGGTSVTHQVRLVGHGVGAKKGHLDTREDSVARLQARALGSNHVKPPTSTPLYTDMLAAAYAARHLCLTHDRGDEMHARELLIPVSRRLDELMSSGQEKLHQFGAGNHAGISALSMSQAAISDWIQKLSLGATVEPQHLLHEFEIGAETIRFLTGERDDAKDLRGFDHATRLVGAGAAGLVAAPALAALVVEEVPLLALVGRQTAERALLWGAAHPVLATELVSSFIGVNTAINSWDDFVQALQDPREAAFLIMQVAMELAHLHQARMGASPRATPKPTALTPDDVAVIRGELHERVQTVRNALGAIEHEGGVEPPTAADYTSRYEAPTQGSAIKQAQVLASNPGTIYHHNVGKGGTRAIASSAALRGGDGTASFGGGTSVRAWFGEASTSPGSPRISPTIEFTVDSGLPEVRFYMGTPGAKWNVDQLPIHIRRILLPDGRIAVPISNSQLRLTAPDGTESTMETSELPE